MRCLYALQATIPQLSRSALHRCFQRHGISRLPLSDDGQSPPKKKFNDYPIGYLHVDFAEVQTEEGQLPSATRRADMHDSLQRAFEQEPPFIRVAYAHNWQREPASTPVVLFVTHRGNPVMVRAVAGEGFLLPPGAGDSLALGVTVAGHLQWFDPVPAGYFADGATVAFGYVDRAHLRKPARTDEDVRGMDEEVRMVREPLARQHWRRARGLVGVRYQIIYPLMYGDGTVRTTTVPVFLK